MLEQRHTRLRTNMNKQERDALTQDERNALTIEQINEMIRARIALKCQELIDYAAETIENADEQSQGVHNVFLALDDLDNVY